MSRKLIISASLKIELGAGVDGKTEGCRVGAKVNGAVEAEGSVASTGWKGVDVGVLLQDTNSGRTVLSGSCRGVGVDVGAG
ncbi:MAG TPA: hypothetical protein VE136_03805 [Anaerolineales bacterium]|jgi:hypothetical protein|nr:hypothetical protein [Anaerolineales bacterium]